MLQFQNVQPKSEKRTLKENLLMAQSNGNLIPHNNFIHKVKRKRLIQKKKSFAGVVTVQLMKTY